MRYLVLALLALVAGYEYPVFSSQQRADYYRRWYDGAGNWRDDV